MTGYFKSLDFPIHLLAAWWMFWLAASYTELSEFVPPSGATLAQFALLLVSFVCGHFTIKHLHSVRVQPAPPRAGAFQAGSTRMRLALQLGAALCASLLAISLYLSGAFTSGFVEYFAKLRLEEGGGEPLTGIRVLDVLTKILAFPLSYTVILVILASDIRPFRYTLMVCILNLLAYSYLWQVNYPVIHLFWFMVFRSLIVARQRGAFDGRTMLVMLLLFATLLASAVNRFGGDVVGGLQRYIVGYHLVGFSFYDHQYQDANSILHVHSFGRSSLGFLDQMLEAAAKIVGVGYKASSFENATFNDQAIDIGLHEIREFNAFGTLLFSLYRDFHLVGVLAGGFAYGALATHTLYRSAGNWACGALFLILASSWMMGMMVNPLEQAYFWFAVVALGSFVLINRGLRL